METDKLVNCYKCGGTGKLDADTNELALLIEKFNESNHDELEMMINAAMDRGQVKKNRRKHIATLIRYVFARLKDETLNPN